MFSKPIVVVLLSCWTGISFCQNEDAFYLQKSTQLDIRFDGSEIKIEEQNFREKIFNHHFENHTRESLYYSDFDPIIAFEAETIIAKGSSSRKVKVETTETKDIVQPGIFYGGYKRKEFVYPAVSTGAIGRLSYTRQIKDPHLILPFYFSENIHVRQSKFSVAVPANIAIQFKLFGNDTEKVAFQKEQVRDKFIYTWTMKEVPAWEHEKDAPARSYTSPHVIVFIESYQHKGGTHKVLSGVDDLYRWYNGLIQQIPSSSNDQELKDTAIKLTQGLASDKEKVRAIFQWVQKNIKYVAFEDGMAGFVPRSATDVYIKRYGDCKDMANILRHMINIVGINAYHTWIGTRDKPYSYHNVPSTIADNHMICSVNLDGEFLFLDATNPFLSFGNPTSMIQGKEALIGISEDNFKVVKVPVLDKHQNARTDTVFVSMNDSGVKGRVVSTLTGYRKNDLELQTLRASLLQNKQYIRDFFQIGDNNIQTGELSMLGFDSPDDDAKIMFDFTQPGYFKKIAGKIYINLAINKSSPGEKIEIASRRQPVERDYHYSDVSVTVFEIPSGYTITHLPKGDSFDSPEFGFRSSYLLKDDKLFFVREIFSSHLYLEKSGFSQWNSFIQALTEINNKTVTLSPKT